MRMPFSKSYGRTTARLTSSWTGNSTGAVSRDRD